ncbi:metallophosphoesterase [Neisseriaceae bacterium B1]
MRIGFFSIFTLLLLQFFSYGFARALMWQFRITQPKARRYTYIASFIFSNGLMILTMLRVWLPMFRITANWLVLLLFISFTAIIIMLLTFALKRFVRAEKLGRPLRLVAPLILLGIYALALYNAYTPTVRYAHIQINKPLAKPLRIGVASDLHLGALFGNQQIDDLVRIMQQEKADMILLPGDIMDDNTLVYDADKMHEHLSQLRAPLGVYATIGNHDIGYQGVPQYPIITDTLQKAGIEVLTNRAVQINHELWVVGLPDQMMNQGRAPLTEVLRGVDTKQAVFVLDHRPNSVLEHAQLPIDLQVSGHVHNGQVFPANFIVRFLNRIHYGYEQINNSHFVVTSGYGFWGVPFRLGSQSEVWIVEVRSNSVYLGCLKAFCAFRQPFNYSRCENFINSLSYLK